MASRGGLATRQPALATFGVMVIAIVGGGVLALPTALATFGPRRAAVIVVVMGLVNLATLSALAGAISRSTAPSSGRGRLATLTSEHLGETGALIALIASVLLWFGLLVVYVLGLAGSLAGLAGPEWIWAVVIVSIVAVLLFAQARELFIASAAAVAVINLVILFVMIGLVATKVDGNLLSSGPSNSGGAKALQLVFGTVLFAYNGHTALFSVAPEVARADPSGRALRRGAISAMVAAIVINVSWVLVCLGTVPPDEFANETSTGVHLLAKHAGSALEPLSAIFAILALGFGGLNAAFALGDVIGERLPGLRRLSTILRPGASVQILEPYSTSSITLAVVADEGERVIVARGRRGRRQAREVIADSMWDGRAMLDQLGVTRRHAVLRVLVDGEAAGGVVLTIESTLPMTEHEPPAPRAALLGSDEGADHLATLIVQAAVRRPAAPSEIVTAVSESTSIDAKVVEDRLEALLQSRRLSLRDDGFVHPVLGSRHRAKTALVQQLYAELAGEITPTDDVADHSAESRREALADGIWRRLALAAPAPIALVTVLALLASGASFATVLDLVAMATIVLLAGILPLLLEMSLRRRAERSVHTPRLLGLPIQLSLLAFFTAVTVIYAVVIYDAWYQKAVAALAFVISSFSIIASRRSGAFDRRSTLLVETDAEGQLHAAALDSGTAADLQMTTDYVEGRRSLVIDIPGGVKPPLLLLALDGEAIPAELGEWSFMVGQSTIASGYLEDSAGEVIEWPASTQGPVRCVWNLR